MLSERSDLAYARSVAELVASAEASDVAPRPVEPTPGSWAAGSTYLDRTFSAIAAALRGDPGALRGAREVVFETEDAVTQALVELAMATVGAARGDPDALERRLEADARWHELGVEPEGWKRLFAIAAATRR